MNRFEDILRCSDSHEISRAVGRHIRLDRVDNAVHFLRLLAYRKSADRVSVEVKLGDPFHVLDTQILICASLIYSEKHLLRVDRGLERIQSLHLGLAAFKPTCRPLARSLCIIVFRGIFNTLVKRHCDSGCEIRLYAHALFGTHKDMAPVHMRREINALFLYASELRQREHLKSAAVREDGSAPARKLAKPAEIVNKRIARTYMKVVCIGKHDLAVDLAQILRAESAFYRSAGCHVHEHGRFDRAVRCLKPSASCASVFFNKCEHYNSL